MRRLRIVRTASCAAVVALVLAGCSNSESPAQKRPQAGIGTATTVAGVQRIVVDTGSDLRFHPSTLVVHRGKVHIVLRNIASGGSGGPPHDLQVSGLPGADVPTVAVGQTASVTFMAPAPGRYRFICSYHVQQGQTGTLVVKAGQG